MEKVTRFAGLAGWAAYVIVFLSLCRPGPNIRNLVPSTARRIPNSKLKKSL